MAADPTPRPQVTPAAPIGAATEAVRPYGKYFLVRKLAEGGMAEIFLAKQVGAEGFERNVVIKRMLQHLSSVTDFVGMFLDEARLAARLAHQNIVQINDLGLVDGCYYIAMEYLPGEDFSTCLRTAGRRREYVPIGVVCRVITEACNGLQFAHDFADDQGRPLNIVHRDISPSNIFVTYSGQVKVLDFGIARAESRVTNTTAGVVKGKYMYMAPEQARGLPVDRRADVFSLGVSLYEALTNVRPFSRDNDLAILNAVLRCEFRPPRQLRPDLPQELEAIVLKAMAGKLEDRYPSAGAMAADLERFLAASTSATGGAQVATYVRSLFGEERVAAKTRIPTLASLTPPGMQLPGFSPDAKTQAVQVNVAAQGAVAPAAAAAKSEPAPSASKRARARAGWLIGGVLLGLAAFGGAFVFIKSQEPAAVAAAPAPVTEPVAAQTSPAAAVAPQEPAATPEVAPAVATTASTQPQTADQRPAEADPEPVKTVAKTTTSTRAKPITLDAAVIQRVVSRGSSTIMRCFETNKGDLPADKGRVGVNFTILSSGKVTNAKVVGDLAGTKVASCLAANVSRLKFPAHTDKEVTLTVPFEFTVQR